MSGHDIEAVDSAAWQQRYYDYSNAVDFAAFLGVEDPAWMLYLRRCARFRAATEG